MKHTEKQLRADLRIAAADRAEAIRRMTSAERRIVAADRRLVVMARAILFEHGAGVPIDPGAVKAARWVKNNIPMFDKKP